MNPELSERSWAESRRAEVEAILARYPERRSAIMPLLHLAQESRGYIEQSDIEAVAEIVGQTPAYVESVASFYALYKRRPVGRYVITVCGNLACALAGADSLVAHLQKRLGVKPGQTTADGLFTLETTGECLAACDGAPVMQINLEYFHRVTAAKADGILQALREGKLLEELAEPPIVAGRKGEGAGGQ